MSAPPPFFVLCVVGLLCFLSYNQVRMPVLALFAESLGAGPEAIGVIVAVSTLTGVLLKLPSGALSDILGRSTLLRLGVLAFCLPPFVYPFVSDLGALTLLRFVHGLATAIFGPIALATVADLWQERRGEGLGWYTASTQAGAFMGPVLGGWLVHAAGFPVTFVSAALFGFLGLALLLMLRLPVQPTHKRAPEHRSPLADFMEGIRATLQNTGILVTSVAEAAKMLAKGALMAFLPLYGISVGLHPGEVGLLFGMQGLTSFVAKPAMGRLSDRVGRRPLIVLGLLTCAASFGMIPHTTEFGFLLGLAAVFGIGDAVMTTSTAALVADLSTPNTLGTGMGFQGTIVDIGHAAGPLLSGVLIGLIDYQWAFAIIAVLQLMAAILFLGNFRLVQPAAGSTNGGPVL